MNRATELRASGERALRLVQRPHIGARWTPEHVVRQDSASGFYEELNAPSSRLSADAVALQAALLSRPRPSSRIADWIFATALGVIGAALAAHFLAM